MLRRQESTPAVVDLFCGAGGLSLGFQTVGCQIILGVDIDEAAATAFRRNFSILQPEDPPRVISGDEANLGTLGLARTAREQRPDILIGGPPCQAFSRLGRGKLDSLSEEGFEGDPRNALYQQFLELAGLWQPLAFVMENVPGMLSVKGQNVADEAAIEMERLGYRVGYAILNAVWYGVPQYRERIIFIGIRRDLGLNPAMPAATHHADLSVGYAHTRTAVSTLPLLIQTAYELPISFANASRPATTVADALEDLPELTDHLRERDGAPPNGGASRGDFRRPLSYRGEPHSEYARLMRRWPGFPPAESVFDHAIRRTPRDYETFRRMKHGDRYPQALEIAEIRFCEELIRLAEDRRAPRPGGPEFKALRDRFVPPYREHDFVDKWRKLNPCEPAWTVPAHLAKDTYSHIHYDHKQARSISVREAARLQSFPDAFFFSGNMGDCFRQIGNAVPSLMAWAIAHTVTAAIGFRGTPPPL